MSGSDLATYVKRNIFNPLRLAAVIAPVATIPRKATSYVRKGGGWSIADSKWEQVGDGAVQTTPTELVRWASEYWKPTIGPSSINAQRLDGAVPAGPGVTYGLGITETNVPGLGRVLGHGGAWGGFVTSFAVVPERQLAFAGTCTAPDVIGNDPALDILRAWAAVRP